MTITQVCLLLLLVLGFVSCTMQTPSVKTVSPSITPFSTKTSTTTQIPIQPQPAISPTPILIEPTLSAIDSMAYLISASENNGGCNLPCIWGFDPRINSADEFGAFIQHFGDINSDNYSISKTRAALSLYFWDDNLKTQTSFYRMGEKEIQYLFLDVIAPSATQSNYYSHYSLSETLIHYGKPTTIFFGPEPEDDVPTRQASWIPFGIVLFYPNQGFLIHYILPKEVPQEHDKDFKGCLNKLMQFTVISWNPTQNKSIEDILEEIPQFSWQWMSEARLKDFYKPIEQIMPIDQFYETYKNSNHPECIQVPMSLWFYK